MVNFVGKFSSLFWIRLIPDAKLQLQRPSEVPNQSRENLKAFLDDMQKIAILN